MKRLFILLTLTITALQLSAQNDCNLQNFSYEVVHQDDGFYFHITEPNPNILAENYKITVNNEQFANTTSRVGPFKGDCETNYTLELIHKELDFCGVTAQVGKVCSESCGAPLFEIVSQECDEAGLQMKLEKINGDFTNNLTVQINEEYISSFEIDGPYLYLKSSLPVSDSLNVVTVCNVGFADVCCATVPFFVENCDSTSTCGIYNIRYEIQDCQQGEEVFLKLDFNHEKTKSDSFIVRGNGIFYGEYAYTDLPVSVGPFESACDQIYELVIRDSEDETCKGFIDGFRVCCHQGCLEPIFELVSNRCINELLYLKLELIHPLNDSLLINLNGESNISYQLDYPYLYIEYPVSNSDEKYELQLCSFGNSGEICCYAQVFERPECEFEGDCKIGDLFVEPSSCLDSVFNGFYVNFDYANVGSKGFTIKGNGQDYGDYRYEDLPVFIQVEENCDLFYEFVVIDNERECRSSIEFGTYCCNNGSCSFRAVDQRVKCEEGILTEVAFYLEEITDPIKNYEVFINDEFIGFTEKNNVFLEFETSIPILTNDKVILTICDSECCIDYDLDVSDCLVNPPTCEINGVTIDQLSCGDEGLSFVLDFDHQGTSGSSFDIYSLFGYFGSFKYSQLPLRIEGYPGVGIGLNAMLICDQGTLCCQAHLFNTPLCQSTIDENEVSKVKEVVVDDHRYLVQNPVSNQIELISPVQRNSYLLFDASGQQLLNHTSDDKRSFIESADLKAGIYLVRVENELGIKIEKLIIAK